MKRIALILSLFTFSVVTFAQPGGYSSANDLIPTTLHVGLRLGGGLATENNYNVEGTADLEVYYPVHGFFFGANLQYQSMGVYYQKTSPEAAFSSGYAGYSLLNQSSYFNFTPEILIPFGPRRAPCMFDVYIDGGVGVLMSGKETVRKWDSTYQYPLNAVYNYDSSINTSKNIFTMVYRYGFGMTEHVVTSHQMTVTFTEDFSYIYGDLSSTTSPNLRSAYSPRSLSPVYFTFKVGVNFYRKKHYRS